MKKSSRNEWKISKKIVKTTQKEIIKISKLVGSDVLLGLNSTNSILNSKNKIKRFTDCRKIYTLIVKPNLGCSTKKIYSKIRKFDKPKLNKPSKDMFNLNNLKKMTNSLEPIALSMHLFNKKN